MSGREELFLASAYRAAFRQAGFRGVFHFLEPRGARLLRRLPDRTNWKLELEVQGEPRAFFLKCHRAPRLGPQPGIVEWNHHRTLAENGIPVPDAAAAGRDPGGESFFCSAELEGAVTLEDLLAAPERRCRTRVRRLAELVRRLHAIPMCHRDLYLCHVFVRAEDETLFLIDLQRLLGRPGGRLRRRWRVKDLAALRHSSNRPAVTRSDRLRFLLTYLDRRRVDPEVRDWVRRVERKARRLGRHRPRFTGEGGRWEQPGGCAERID